MGNTTRVLAVMIAAALAAALVIWLARDRDTTVGPSAAPAQDAARVRLERVPGTCAVVFAEGEPSMSAEAVSLAALGCRTIDASTADAAVSVVIAPLAGPAELVEEAGLAPGVVARVTLGTEPAGCGAPRGLIALVALRGRRLDVEAIGPWTGSCGSIEPLSVASGDAGLVMIEPVEQAQESEDEPTAKLVVYRRVGADIVRLATIAE